ncbi:uncharacterized protein LOC114434248 isoform X2 [Parambassis ranga]|uniref:Uncharacterized protein LOC114434248 isoform X2 n=1 Tax=Parambassis ranga TaxID=210632 RepID=A0A6P7I3F2_9TELE|nr:uncharacterized protein LOC114434248 isoform X2 [Parambassis ranga]
MLYIKMWKWIVLLFCGIIIKVHGYSNGVFPEACESMAPNHIFRGKPFSPQTNGNPPFQITIIENNPEGPITVILEGQKGETFRGFMLEARIPGENHAVGKFIKLEPDQTTLMTCSGLEDSAASQSLNHKKHSLRINWTAGAETTRNIQFRATFLKDFSTFWVNVTKDLSLTTTTTESATPTTTTTESATPTTTTTESATPTTTTTESATPTTTTTESATTTTTTESATLTTTTTDSATPTTPTTESATPTTTTPSTTPTTTTTESATPTTTTTESATTTTSTESATITVARTTPTITSITPNSTSTESATPTNTTPTTTLTTTTPSTTTPTIAPNSTTAKSATPTTSTAPSTTVATSMPDPTVTGTHSHQSIHVHWETSVLLMTGDCIVEAVKVGISNIFTVLCAGDLAFRRLYKVSKFLTFTLCVILEVVSVVLLCLRDPINVTLVALVSSVMLINCIELVLACLPIGPSHELKEICDLSDKVCCFIHTFLTVTVIFFGAWQIENCRNNIIESWLLKVLIVLTVWIFLNAIFVFIFSIHKKAILGKCKMGNNKKQQRAKNLSTPRVIVCAVFLLFDVGTAAFLVAVIAGILVCPQG